MLDKKVVQPSEAEAQAQNIAEMKEKLALIEKEVTSLKVEVEKEKAAVPQARRDELMLQAETEVKAAEEAAAKKAADKKATEKPKKP